MNLNSIGSLDRLFDLDFDKKPHRLVIQLGGVVLGSVVAGVGAITGETPIVIAGVSIAAPAGAIALGEVIPQRLTNQERQIIG